VSSFIDKSIQLRPTMLLKSKGAITDIQYFYHHLVQELCLKFGFYQLFGTLGKDFVAIELLTKCPNLFPNIVSNLITIFRILTDVTLDRLERMDKLDSILTSVALSQGLDHRSDPVQFQLSPGNFGLLF
jgi:hypothetical protein